MQQRLILDTNIFLYDPQAMENFSDSDLIIPLEVIEEIDKFKHGASETGRNARRFALLVDALRSHGSLKNGIKIGKNCTLRIVSNDYSKGTASSDSASEAILRLALQLRQDATLPEPVIVSKNVNLRVKADALGLLAQDYEPLAQTTAENLYGWRRMEFPEAEMAALQNGNTLNLHDRGLNPNEYVFAHEPGNPKNGLCARMDFEGQQLWPILDTEKDLCGIRSLNIEQSFSIDALCDPNISLVTLSGKAGTGKTLLAIAAGLQQIFSECIYQGLLVFRPTMPVSRDLGYLPGEINEKMRPWMQPVFDALEFIRSKDRKNPVRVLPNDLMDCPELSVEPLTYIRGRSIPNQFIIIDEAQNLTPLEVKTVVTRVGSGSKVVLTGDPEQIDTPYLDARSNGFSCLIERFMHSPLSAHVTLLKGERSELAETAASLL
ncbi:MAG: PhoH family protein [Oligosphaeraceae bacterium]|nr:PhoH family protein [Oligosphaeraceae bacterium]